MDPSHFAGGGSEFYLTWYSHNVFSIANNVLLIVVSNPSRVLACCLIHSLLRFKWSGDLPYSQHVRFIQQQSGWRASSTFY